MDVKVVAMLILDDDERRTVSELARSWNVSYPIERRDEHSRQGVSIDRAWSLLRRVAHDLTPLDLEHITAFADIIASHVADLSAQTDRSYWYREVEGVALPRVDRQPDLDFEARVISLIDDPHRLIEAIIEIRESMRVAAMEALDLVTEAMTLLRAAEEAHRV